MSPGTTVLVTGATGFVGRHLTSALEAHFGATARIVATGFSGDLSLEHGSAQSLDITDAAAVDQAIASVQPTHLVHLSAIAATADASANPRLTWEVNTLGTLTVAEAVLRKAPQCRLIFAGTGLIYGSAADPARPYTETAAIAPQSEYAVTKAAADLLLGAMGARGLKSVRFRLFNHTGPGQSEAFVVPRLAAQVARIEAGLQPATLKVGNLQAIRDFLDVRDVAAAYIRAIDRASTLPDSAVINIASGKAQPIGEILDQLLSLSSSQIQVESSVGPGHGGTIDSLVGDPALAAKLLGWRPQYELGDTLATVLAYWRRRVADDDADIS